MLEFKMIKFENKISPIRLVNENQYNPGAICNIDETWITFDSPSNFTLEYNVGFYYWAYAWL